MSAVLSEAETKFFSSSGQDVDPSLKAPEVAAEPVKPPITAVPDPVTAPAATEPVAPTQQQVPLAALHEERQKRSRAEAERQALQTQLEQLTQQIQQAQKAQQRPPPDPNQDPIGAALYETQATKAQMEELRQWREQQDQVAQYNTQRQQFQQALTSSEAVFRTKQPDYDQALNYAMGQYEKLLSVIIPDPAARHQRALQEAVGAVYTVMQEGRDPAQFLYDTAKSMGYTGPQPVPNPGGNPAIPAIPALPQTVPEVVKTIERGLKQQANPGGGGSPNSEITPEMALALPAAEYNKWWAKQFRR